MTTAIIFHEVQDGAVWAKAWKKGPGSRHEMFGKLGINCRTFRDPKNPAATGLIAEIPDMAKFQALLQSRKAKLNGPAQSLYGRTAPISETG